MGLTIFGSVASFFKFFWGSGIAVSSAKVIVILFLSVVDIAFENGPRTLPCGILK